MEKSKRNYQYVIIGAHVVRTTDIITPAISSEEYQAHLHFAKGRYLGEGFDDNRLGILILSNLQWARQGTVAQSDDCQPITNRHKFHTY